MRAMALLELALAIVWLAAAAVQWPTVLSAFGRAVLLVGTALGITGAVYLWALADLREGRRPARWVWALRARYGCCSESRQPSRRSRTS